MRIGKDGIWLIVLITVGVKLLPLPRFDTLTHVFFWSPLRSPLSPVGWSPLGLPRGENKVFLWSPLPKFAFSTFFILTWKNSSCSYKKIISNYIAIVLWSFIRLLLFFQVFVCNDMRNCLIEVKILCSFLIFFWKTWEKFLVSPWSP